MSRSVGDYVALSLMSSIDWDPDADIFSGRFSRPTEFSGDMEQLKAQAEKRCGFLITSSVLDQAVRTLATCGVLRITDDNYSGTFVKLKPSEFEKFIERAKSESNTAREDGDELSILSRPSDYPNASALIKHELLEDYHELGEDWLRRALEGIRRSLGADGRLPDELQSDKDLEVDAVPASDRTVSLSDNDRSELETVSNDLIDAVEKTNAVDGDPTFRQFILGQLKAGRELIRAQIFNAQVMHLLMMDALRTLVEKYEGHVIGATAATLIELLIKSMAGTS